MIATRRTGSNLLLSYLNSIPNASFAGEILNQSMYYGVRRRFISKKTVMRHIAYSIHDCPRILCGAKIIKIHLDSHRISLFDLKALFPNGRFIVLYRKSILDQFVSLKIAQATDTWQWTNGFKLPPSIYISPAEFKEYSQMTKAFYEGLFKYSWFKDFSIVVSYEDLAENAQEIFNETVFPFLRVPPSPVQSCMIKQNTRPLCQLIENYQEIAPFVHHPMSRQDYSTELKPVLVNHVA